MKKKPIPEGLTVNGWTLYAHPLFLEQLEKLCIRSEIKLTLVPPQKLGTETVSSSLIRKRLKSGDVLRANEFLVAPFKYQGVVRKGDGRGRQIGFPTANLIVDEKLTLPFGVYETRVQVRSPKVIEEKMSAVTNVGVRPTFGKNDLAPLVETHIIDKDIDLYGRELRVEFLRMIRPERLFSGVTELITQIRIDIEQVRKSS